MHMRKIILTEFVTLDGVMEDPGGGSFKYAGWTWPYGNDEFMKFKSEELFASDALLLGRVTYEGFAKSWPTMEGTGAFGEKMNSMIKYVVSDTLKTADWNNSHIIRGNVREEVLKLKEESGKDILVNGSSELAQTLMEHNMIDVYRLLVYPIVLGSGKHLFKEGVKIDLSLINVQSFTTGLVLLEYQAGKEDN